MEVIVYLGDILILFLSAMMLIFSYFIIRHHRSFLQQKESRFKLWHGLVLLLCSCGAFWLATIAAAQPLEVMSGAKGSAHGWAVFMLSISTAVCFLLLTFQQLMYWLHKR